MVAAMNQTRGKPQRHKQKKALAGEEDDAQRLSDDGAMQRASPGPKAMKVQSKRTDTLEPTRAT